MKFYRLLAGLVLGLGLAVTFPGMAQNAENNSAQNMPGPGGMMNPQWMQHMMPGGHWNAMPMMDPRVMQQMMQQRYGQGYAQGMPMMDPMAMQQMMQQMHGQGAMQGMPMMPQMMQMHTQHGQLMQQLNQRLQKIEALLTQLVEQQAQQ